jgi:hypothetical protein
MIPAFFVLNSHILKIIKCGVQWSEIVSLLTKRRKENKAEIEIDYECYLLRTRMF